MARNNSKPTDPADHTRRVWVIERRGRTFTGGNWRTFDIRTQVEFSEAELVQECSNLSERYTGNEFRYRAATLTFDDDGSKCVIY